MTRRFNDVLKDLNQFTSDVINRKITEQAKELETAVEEDMRNFFSHVLKGIDRESAPTLRGRFGDNFTPEWPKLRLGARKRKLKKGVISNIGQQRFFFDTGKLQAYFTSNPDPTPLLGRIQVTTQANIIRTGNNPGQYRVQGIRNTVAQSGPRAGRRVAGIVPQAEFSTIRAIRVRLRLVDGVQPNNDRQIDNVFPQDVRSKLKNLNKNGTQIGRLYRPLVGPYLRWYLRKRLPELIERRFKDVLVS